MTRSIVEQSFKISRFSRPIVEVLCPIQRGSRGSVVLEEEGHHRDAEVEVAIVPPMRSERIEVLAQKIDLLPHLAVFREGVDTGGIVRRQLKLPTSGD